MFRHTPILLEAIPSVALKRDPKVSPTAVARRKDAPKAKVLMLLSLGIMVSLLGICFCVGGETTVVPGHAKGFGSGQGQGSYVKYGAEQVYGHLAGAIPGVRSNPRPISARPISYARSSSGKDEDADICEQVYFHSSPELVRRAIFGYVQSNYPAAMPYIKLDPTSTTLSASRMGASCSIVLSGTGPTVVDIRGDIGFPASLFCSEDLVRKGLNQAIRVVKKKTS